MCEFGVLDVFDCTPTEPHGLTTLLYRRQPPPRVTAFGSLRFASLRHPQGGLLEGRSALPIYRNIFTLPTSPTTQRQSKRFRKGSERSCFAQIQRLDTCQNLPTEFVFPLCKGYFWHTLEIQLPIRKLLYKSCLSVFLLIPTVG